MAKLKLDVDQLEVESFTIPGADARVGTVRGRITPPNHPDLPPSYDACSPGGGGGTAGTCIGPTYCCGATGPTNPVCVGPTYCCNPTANTGCCPAPTDGCPATPYYASCYVSCVPKDCMV